LFGFIGQALFGASTVIGQTTEMGSTVMVHVCNVNNFNQSLRQHLQSSPYPVRCDNYKRAFETFISTYLQVKGDTMIKLNVLIGVLVIGITQLAFDGDDPSINGQQRLDIKMAMGTHIQDSVINGQYVIFDANNGTLKKLTLKELHQGVVKKGGFYVSCADFVDAQGKLYDLDFLVAKKANQYRVVKSLVHYVDGNKFKYHTELVLAEIAMNHNKHLNVEYPYHEYQELQAAMDRLDFKLTPIKNLPGKFSLLGGRYCSN
jgi:hypothetical protein